MSMLLLTIEMTLQIHILTFSLVWVTCLSCHDIYSWSCINFSRFAWCWSYARSLLHGSHIEFRSLLHGIHIEFLGSVPPRICSLVGSYFAITGNRTNVFWCTLTAWMYGQDSANAFSKKSSSHDTYWTPTPRISLRCIWISSLLTHVFYEPINVMCGTLGIIFLVE